MAMSHTNGSRMLRPVYSSKALPRAWLGRDNRQWPFPSSVSCLSISHGYATLGKLEGSLKGSIPPRKAVTVVNDDGRVPWSELSTGEKAARATQQTFNLGVVLAGAIGTALVGYFLYQEVFSTDSKTRHFNKAVAQVRADSRALELLGSGKTIRAFGEPSGSKWTRNRPLASSTQTDRTGIEHFRMHFNVEGSERLGVVSMHMVKGPGDALYHYRFLALDVPGHPRLYLENAEDTREKKKPGFRMLGVQWR